MNHKTVGAVASDLQNRSSGKIDPREIQQAQEQEYLDNLVWAVKHARRQVDCSALPGHESCTTREAIVGDFYISALLKKEKLLENVLRNYFVPSLSCPTPFFDQTVYKYNAAKEDIEFLWVVPDQETCLIFKENKEKIVPAEQGLLRFVLDYYNGNLTRLAKKENKETMAPGVLLEGF